MHIEFHPNLIATDDIYIFTFLGLNSKELGTVSIIFLCDFKKCHNKLKWNVLFFTQKYLKIKFKSVFCPFHNWRTSRATKYSCDRKYQIWVVNCSQGIYKWKSTHTKLARFKATVLRCKCSESCYKSCVDTRLMYNESECCMIMQ